MTQGARAPFELAHMTEHLIMFLSYCKLSCSDESIFRFILDITIKNMTRVFYTTFTKIPMRKSAYEIMCAIPVPAAATLNPPPPHHNNALTYSLLLTEHYRSFS